MRKDYILTLSPPVTNQLLLKFLENSNLNTVLLSGSFLFFVRQFHIFEVGLEFILFFLGGGGELWKPCVLKKERRGVEWCRYLHFTSGF